MRNVLLVGMGPTAPGVVGLVTDKINLRDLLTHTSGLDEAWFAQAGGPRRSRDG